MLAKKAPEIKPHTKHSSRRLLLTAQTSTLSVFCSSVTWEMATLKISLNKMVSMAGWTLVRNRQLISAEDGRTATLTYLPETKQNFYRCLNWCLLVMHGRSSPHQLKDCIATKWNSNLAVEWKKGGKDEWGTLVPCRNISQKGIFVPGKVGVAREAAVSDFIQV